MIGHPKPIRQYFLLGPAYDVGVGENFSKENDTLSDDVQYLINAYIVV